MADEAIQTRIARQLHEFKREFVPKVAALKRPVLGNDRVSKAERQRRWWDVSPDWPSDPELSQQRETLLLTGMNPDGTPAIDPQTGQPVKKMTPEDVGLLKYPNREIDARAAGKGDERATAKYAKEMSDMGPPPPDPLAAGLESQIQPAIKPDDAGFY